MSDRQVPSAVQAAVANYADVAAQNAQAVINELQNYCQTNDVPTYRYCQDMQELTSATLALGRLAQQYREKGL